MRRKSNKEVWFLSLRFVKGKKRRRPLSPATPFKTKDVFSPKKKDLFYNDIKGINNSAVV